MKNESLVRIWLKRAKSNLQIAKAGKVFEDILFEDLGVMIIFNNLTMTHISKPMCPRI